jgi:putative ABC transport system substrate-binding protein
VERLVAFRQGLKETGYVEGENLSIVYRWADNQLDRLPELAADLVRRRVGVIATVSAASIFAAKAATSTIPIIFLTGDDPVEIGLVSSLAHPGGNLSGISFSTTELAAKRLELLRELMPRAARVAVLVNPANAKTTEATLQDLETAARSMGLQIRVFNADTSREINAAFASIEHERPDALFVATTPFLNVRAVQLVQLAAFHRLPATYGLGEYVQAGGLMSYGASTADVYRQAGVYAGRILMGTKPTDLPVLRSSKFELVINAETARMLGITVPPTLLSFADRVIE